MSAVTLARDRVGIKPLYYAQVRGENGTPGSFIFASEIKAILATGLVRRAINVEGLNQYLTFLWTPDPHTLFQNIWKLPPAHVLTLSDGQLNQREWWDVSFDEIEEGRSEEWWRERVLETLDRAVRMERSRCAPGVGFFPGC